MRQQRNGNSVECQSRKSQVDVKNLLNLGSSRSPVEAFVNKFQKARLNQSDVRYGKDDLSQRSRKSCELYPVGTFSQSPQRNARRSHSSLVKCVKQSEFGDMISKAAHAPPTIQQSEMLLSHHSKSVKSVNKSVKSNSKLVKSINISVKSISKYSRSVHDISPRILNISARV